MKPRLHATELSLLAMVFLASGCELREGLQCRTSADCHGLVCGVEGRCISTQNGVVKLQVIDQACGDARSPLEGVTHFQLRLTGDGFEPSAVLLSREQGWPAEVAVPAGAGRQLELRGYAGEPSAGGQVVSLGRSNRFDMPASLGGGQAPPTATIFLRRVNAFARPAAASSPGTCVGLRGARAGHTATLLPDGRVFVAGGYQLNGSRRTALSTAEVYYPSTGDFSQAAELAFVSPNQVINATPRAFHTATLMDSKTGQVLVTGGETFTDSGSPAPITLGLLYDPGFNDYGVIRMQAERSRHQAVQDASGRVLLVGGMDKTGAPHTTLESYQMGLAGTTVAGDVTGAPLSLKRVGHSVTTIQGGKYIVVAGGHDGTTLQDAVRFLNFDGERFVFVDSQSPQLRDPRRLGVLAPFRNNEQLLLLGGYNAASESSYSAVTTSELIKSAEAFQVSDGPTLANARGNLCAASLPDGRVLTVGGFVSDGVTGARSDSSAELISDKGDGTAFVTALPPLDRGRHHHTCTTLQDGTVLVLGGVNAVGSTQAVLDEALIFTPAPLD